MNYPDIYFTPEYQALFKDTEFGGIIKEFNDMVHWMDYRFYKRGIEDTGYFDIVSPYGYSGPIYSNEDPSPYGFLERFHEYCLEENIVSEFARLHPFLGNHRYLDPKCIHYEHDIFYIDLTQTQEEIWKGFDKGCKSTINKQFKNMPNAKHGISEFKPLYIETMKRIDADKSYYFNDEFWAKSSQIISYAGNEEAMVAVIPYGDYVHYFLSATKPKASVNLVLYTAILTAKEQGYKIFNLGGGLRKGDSLESFKKSFTKISKPFYTYRKVHNQTIYDKLCQEKGIDPNNEGFFPAYRREKK